MITHGDPMVVSSQQLFDTHIPRSSAEGSEVVSKKSKIGVSSDEDVGVLTPSRSPMTVSLRRDCMMGNIINHSMLKVNHQVSNVVCQGSTDMYVTSVKADNLSDNSHTKGNDLAGRSLPECSHNIHASSNSSVSSNHRHGQKKKKKKKSKGYRPQ